MDSTKNAEVQTGLINPAAHLQQVGAAIAGGGDQIPTAAGSGEPYATSTTAPVPTKQAGQGEKSISMETTGANELANVPEAVKKVASETSASKSKSRETLADVTTGSGKTKREAVAATISSKSLGAKKDSTEAPKKRIKIKLDEGGIMADKFLIKKGGGVYGRTSPKPTTPKAPAKTVKKVEKKLAPPKTVKKVEKKLAPAKTVKKTVAKLAPSAKRVTAKKLAPPAKQVTAKKPRK